MGVQQPYVQLNFEGRGTVYISMVDGAVAGLDEVLAGSDPSTLSTVCQMLEKAGEALEHGENYAAASRVYGYVINAVAKLNSPLNTALALNNQALAYKRGKQWDLALATYQRAADLVREPMRDPDDERERPSVVMPILLNLAVLYTERGERMKAAESAIAALQLARGRTDEASRNVARESAGILRELDL